MEAATASVPKAHLEQFYRLALLLSGHAKGAEKVLALALSELGRHAEQFRSTQARLAWLVARIRQECQPQRFCAKTMTPAPGLLRSEEDSSDHPELLAIEAYLLAQRFAKLSEPGRSALALLHLDLFTSAELPRLLNLSADRFATELAEARRQLRAQIQGMRSAETLPA